MAWLKKRGSIYYIRHIVAGKRKTVCTNTAVYQIAKEKLRQFETALAQGHSPLPTTTPIPEVLEGYIRHVRTTKTAKSAQTDIYYLRDAFGPVCDALSVSLDIPRHAMMHIIAVRFGTRSVY